MIPCVFRSGPPGLCDRCARWQPFFSGRWRTRGLALFVLAFLAASSLAASPDLIERESYDQAIQGIPFDRLTDQAQARIWKIVSQATIYRRLPVTRVQADPEMYLFLVRHPEVIVNMWDLMGVTKVNVRRTSDFTFNANDGAGTTGAGELIYGDKQTHLVIGEGSYEGPVLKRKINGRCLIMLKSDYVPNAGPNTQITHRLDMFVQLDNIGAELVAKTLQPLVGKSADHNFVETSRFLGQISQAAESRPTGMQQLAGRLTKVEPTVRERFATLSAEIYARSATTSSTPVSTAAPMR